MVMVRASLTEKMTSEQIFKEGGEPATWMPGGSILGRKNKHAGSEGGDSRIYKNSQEATTREGVKW